MSDSRGDIEKSLNIKPAALAAVGDLVFHDGVASVVCEVHTHLPGSERACASPIRSDYVVREVVTPSGSRFVGHEPGGCYTGVEILGLRPGGVSFEQ